MLVYLEEEEERGEEAAKDLSPGVFHTVSMKTLNACNARSLDRSAELSHPNVYANSQLVFPVRSGRRTPW